MSTLSRIPEKLFFKIGEVCELIKVQPHVLRYWETEFPMLSPQKNKSGQRSYRRRDVEMALKIKQLLYNEMFTIAGARKKLQSESRGKAGLERQGNHTPRPSGDGSQHAPMLFDTSPEPEPDGISTEAVFHPAHADDGKHREVLRTVASQLLELREMLKTSPV